MWSNALLAVAALALTPVEAIWPVPKSISTGDKVLFINDQVKVTYNGKTLSTNYAAPATSGGKFSSDKIVQAAVGRAFQAIFKDNFVPWKLRERHSNFEPSASKGAASVKSLAITQLKKDNETTFKPLAGEVDESYALTLSEAGEAVIKANSSTGVLHGLESFLQLFFEHTNGSPYTPHAPVKITDEPEYPHRGLLMDVARNFYAVADIKRAIDGLAWNKFNRLHLHITDSQSWPLEIPRYPELAKKGSYGSNAIYSVKDLEDLQEYAVYRGVELIVEIDMPGHIGVLELAEPTKDLIVAYNKQPYQWWCAEPPCGALALGNNDSTTYIENILKDLLPRVAPYSAYFHTGGDELNANDSRLDSGIKSNKTATIQPYLQRFIDTVHKHVRAEGLTPFVWEEMVSTWDMKLGSDVVVQSWLGGGAVANLTKQGHKVIDSDYNYWYLDCGRGQWLTFDETYDQYYPFNDWCGPTKAWQLVYSHDPRAGLSGAQAKRVIGGEVALWSETVDAVNFDSLLWPRASAAGEVLWSGRFDAHGKNRTQIDAAPRLAEMRERMVARGVGASPVRMTFCTQNNPKDCQQL